MYLANADSNKNRLYIKLSGNMNQDEVKKAADSVIAEAKKLKKGFSVINDISEFKPTSQDATTELQRAQEYLKMAGVTKIIRVVNDAKIANMQLNRTGGYKADTVCSLEEAEKLLD
jgi:multidrug efflux pump subunit AcrB